MMSDTMVDEDGLTTLSVVLSVLSVLPVLPAVLYLLLGVDVPVLTGLGTLEVGVALL